MEWYEPAAITTAKGSLVITFSQKETHGLHFEGGKHFLLMRADHWNTLTIIQVCCPHGRSARKRVINSLILHQPYYRNKFCFTGGYFEVAVQLPGLNNVAGMWPAVWTMGNLGRAGYGATLEGMVRLGSGYPEKSPPFLLTRDPFPVAIHVRCMRCRDRTKSDAQRHPLCGNCQRRPRLRICAILPSRSEAL
jgi:Beta-glucan synthesis-associated protein SKN1/KRE6/Sbg1